MGKSDIKKSLITEDDFMCEKDFILKNTNFGSCVEFYNSLEVYTIGDKIKMASKPNIDQLISTKMFCNNSNSLTRSSILLLEHSDFHSVCSFLIVF